MSSDAAARVLRVDGRFLVDPQRRLVRGPDSDLHLRPKTFGVLETLIENRHRAVSKDELLTTVWAGTAVTDDVLVTSITEIRRAFGDDPRASTFIKTIHGTGYRWIASVEEVEASREASVPAEPAVERAHIPRRLFRTAAIAAGLLALFSAGALALRNSWAPVEHESEIAWWKFDEPAGDAVIDSSGRGNDGRIYSGVQRIPGRRGGALQFNGLGDGVAGKAGSSMPVGNSPRSITAWVKTDSTNGDFTSLLHYGLDGVKPPGANFALVLTPDGRIRAGNGFHTGFVNGQSRVDDGAWHFVSTVYDGAPSMTERIYVDGIEDANGPLREPPATINGGTWTIGKFLGDGTRFRGILDDLRVFDRALSPAEGQGLFRCSSGSTDLTSASAYYYLPVMSGAARIENGEIVNSGLDIGGIQLARSDGACGAASLHGAPIGQDLYLSAELKVPVGPNALQSDAGIYFRSRKAHAGDGIMGGTSAGYWVRLNSGGRITVRCLNPGRVVAFANAPDFVPEEYHRLELIAIGSVLKVGLNGKLVEFDQDGKLTTSVSIPSVWEGPPKVGDDDGTVGVAFAADLNRGRLGGQRVRNFIVHVATAASAAQFLTNPSVTPR
jgi:DNA-binding winged helix-turn-helix (wHTH) protein